MAQNKRLHIVVVDDDAQALAEAEAEFLRFDIVKSVEKAQNISEFINIMRHAPADVVFLDIELQGSSGFEMADYIKANYPGVPYAFLTCHTGFALKGYDYSPIDFLTKPINPVRLKKVLDSVAALAGPLNKSIGVSLKGGFELINIDEITHIEKAGRKIYLHRAGASPYEANLSLATLEDMFAGHGFYQCHQSYIVSLKHVARIEADNYTYRITLRGGSAVIPLSRDRYDRLKALLLAAGIQFVM